MLIPKPSTLFNCVSVAIDSIRSGAVLTSLKNEILISRWPWQKIPHLNKRILFWLHHTIAYSSKDVSQGSTIPSLLLSELCLYPLLFFEIPRILWNVLLFVSPSFPSLFCDYRYRSNIWHASMSSFLHSYSTSDNILKKSTISHKNLRIL